MTQANSVPRRRFMQSVAGLALAAGTPKAFAQAGHIVVADPGGPYTAAYRRAFYDPFEHATGIKIINVARAAQPVAQLSAIVKTKNFLWDVTTLTLSQDVPYLESQHLLEPIGLKSSELPDVLPEAVRPDWLGVDIYSTVLTYRTDKYKTNGPASWADFWNVKKFPGRRSLRRSPIDTLEQALMADGVSIDKLYPLNVDRAFKSLDRIKKHIDIWWTSGAQSMQAIQNGDVDMISTWNGRAEAAIDNKAPVKIVWNQGLYSVEGWGILKGTPRAAMAKRFVRFCANAKRQAAFTNGLAYGPTNRKSFSFIPVKQAAILPSAPQNIRDMRMPSPEWWATNRERVTERFNNWIIG